jgi:flagellar protein FlaJ
MQVAIILMTYLTLLGVMAILKTQFLDVMAGLTQQAAGSGGGGGGGPAQFGGGIDTQLLSLLFFHAVTLQAILSGIISGYIRTANLLAGVKFVVILQTIALAVWLVVG